MRNACESLLNVTVGAAVGSSTTGHEAAFGQVGPEPDELAQGMLTLKQQYGFRLFGGCCGTDARHMEAMATLLSDGR